MGKLQGLRPCNFQWNSWKLGTSISFLLLENCRGFAPAIFWGTLENWGHPLAYYYGKIAGASPLQFSGELLETGGIHKLIIGANIFSTKPLASKPRGCINSWLLDGRRPTQRKNQSVGYESKCPGLRLNFRQTFSCLERHFPFLGLTSDLGKESSSRGMKSLPSVLPRPGHLLSYPTERLVSEQDSARLWPKIM